MEPNKLENQIREKLNAREIKPSAQSWDRLDAMLSVEESKKPKSGFNWIYIAAGIVGFVFVGLLFFNQNNENGIIKGDQTVVESNSDQVKSEKEESSQEVILQANPSIEKQAAVKNTAIASFSEPKKEAVKTKEANEKQQQFLKKEIVTQENIAEVVPQKTEEKTKETVNQPVLLASTDPAKSEEQILSKPKLKVDANALLSQVEGEIDLTFRQKAIKRFSKNLKNAKEAVASRNRE